MALSNISEFEAVLGQILVKLDKILYERNDPPKLKQARRDLDRILSDSRDSAKLKGHSKLLTEVSEVIRVEIAEDEVMRNDLWDLSDYIDFNC